MVETSYAIAIGSNRRHGRHGDPHRVVAAAMDALAAQGLRIQWVSRIQATAPLGPAGRSFANAAVAVSTRLAPPEVLRKLKAVERAFGRRRGRRWGPRVLDLDIILWSGGFWEQEGLVIPHRGFRERAFVLEPLAEVAPHWRDPVTGLSVRQLLFRSRRRLPVDPRSTRS